MESKDILIYTEGGGGHYHYLRALFKKEGRPYTDLKVFRLEAKGKSSQVEEVVEEARIVLQVPQSKHMFVLLDLFEPHGRAREVEDFKQWMREEMQQNVGGHVERFHPHVIKWERETLLLSHPDVLREHLGRAFQHKGGFPDERFKETFRGFENPEAVDDENPPSHREKRLNRTPFALRVLEDQRFSIATLCEKCPSFSQFWNDLEVTLADP